MTETQNQNECQIEFRLNSDFAESLLFVLLNSSFDCRRISLTFELFVAKDLQKMSELLKDLFTNSTLFLMASAPLASILGQSLSCPPCVEPWPCPKSQVVVKTCSIQLYTCP